MGIFDFLFGSGGFGDRDLSELKETVKGHLDEAADWREQQWADLEARQEHIRGLNDQLLHLTDQAKK